MADDAGSHHDGGGLGPPDETGLPLVETAPGVSRRVLLVGRDPEEREFLRRSLESRGYHTRETDLGEGVWEALEQFQPQLVVIDVAPHLVDPTADLERIKQSIPTTHFVPCLAIYPHKAPGDIARGFQRGADDFLVRPFDIFELVLRLEVLWRMKSLQDEVLLNNERLHELSVTDDLTGLLNQKEFKRRLELEIRRVRRFGIPVSCVFFDCDRFKAVNDTHGHAMGSHVIKQVARMLVANLRDTDLVCRYGGDEYVVALPGADLKWGVETAERLRNLMKMATFRLGDAECNVTISMGVAACTTEEPIDLDTLLGRADRGLYLAKEGGRDQVRPVTGDDA